MRRPPSTSPLWRALKAPTALYERGWGWMLGHRFLALAHRGRRSGRRYVTVLEVVRWTPATREAVVVSGFGSGAQWFRNVIAGGAEDVRIARVRYPAHARVLAHDEAIAVLADYERRNRLVAPVVRVVLGRLTGTRYDGSESARRRLVAALPFVAFTPAPGTVARRAGLTAARSRPVQCRRARRCRPGW
jgi:deazaflavin-dependent oxidoreductase (nitroreductase family)